MSKSRIIGIMALMVFAVSIFLVGEAAAGEKFKGRAVKHTLKWEQEKVGDEEGHVVAVYETKGIETNLEGKQLFDGWPERETGFMDMNIKTGLGSGHGYGEGTDKDGNKYYFTWEGKCVKAGKPWEGVWTIVKGTGKLEGITGKGTWVNYSVGGGWSYDNWEIEVELPR